MDEGFGGKFWLRFVLVIVGIGIAAMLLFTLVGAVWYTWGVLGCFVIFGGLALVAGWLYDRRQAKYAEETY